MTNLVILESMWGNAGSAGQQAPQWFTINEWNHSGARLHRLLRVDPREGNVWVTNACQTVQKLANARTFYMPHPFSDARWMTMTAWPLSAKPTNPAAERTSSRALVIAYGATSGTGMNRYAVVRSEQPRGRNACRSHGRA